MSRNFDNVPVDPDTRIVSQAVVPLGQYEVLHQRWVWEGIVAESVIFAEDDAKGHTDAELESMLRESSLLEGHSGITIQRSESGFTFLNFNFETG